MFLLPILFAGALSAVAQMEPQLVEDRIAAEALSAHSTLNRFTGEVETTITLQLRNVGDDLLMAPFHVVVRLFGDTANATVRNALGGVNEEPYQAHYFDWSDLVGPSGLSSQAELTGSFVYVRPAGVATGYQIEPYAVFNRPPTAAFVSPDSETVGAALPFDGSESFDPDGGALTYFWDFGDGATSEDVTPVHQYEFPGVYNVRLRVTDPAGATDEARRIVYILPAGDFALARVRALDGVGQPFPQARVQDVGEVLFDLGDADEVGFFFAIGEPGSSRIWRFSGPDHLPVWREVRFGDRTVTLVASPYLARAPVREVMVSPLTPAQIGGVTERATLRFPAGAFSQAGAAGMTPLGDQTLPFPLPRGWRPLCAFHLSVPGQLFESGQVEWHPPQAIGPTDVLAAVVYEPQPPGWRVVQVAAPGTLPTTPIVLPGWMALVIADEAPTAPPLPEVGQRLTGGDAGEGLALVAEGTFDPPEAVASLDPDRVTTRSDLKIEGDGPLASGRMLRADISERYAFLNGGSLRTPDYDTTFFAYRDPAAPESHRLRAEFPLRPTLLFDAGELEEARVVATILDADAFRGAILDPGGGRLSTDAVTIAIPPGAYPSRTVGELRDLDTAGFSALLRGLDPVHAFQFDGPETQEPLGVEIRGVAPGRAFVLARLISFVGRQSLEPVLRMRSDAAGVARGAEPDVPPRLAGMTGGGRYVLVDVDVLPGLVTGTARLLDGTPSSGLAVAIVGEPWMTLTRGGGVFVIVSTPGAGTAEANDAFANRGEDDFFLANSDSVAEVDLRVAPTGPRVVRISPEDGATGVPRVGSVVVEFSEAVQPATLVVGSIELLRPDDSAVLAALTLNLRNNIATLSPATELEANTEYRVRLAATITDLGGLPLEGQSEFRFTTVPLSARDPAAQLIIYEPGATNVPAEVLAQIPAFTPGQNPFAIVVRGTPGVADPEVAVVLVNESSGETATVLSRPDGSFASVITGTEDDFVSATFVNLNGTRVYVPVSRQEFDNGFVGLYPQGGVLEAQSDGGPLQVLIEPGDIPSKTVVGLEPIPLNQLMEQLGGQQPVGGKVMGGFTYHESGDELRGAPDFSVVVDLADFDLPSGLHPSEAVHALTVPREYDGVLVYDMIDTMEFEDLGGGKARLITRSPPFPGLLARRLAALRDAVGRVDRLGSVRTSSAGAAQVGTAVGGAVLTMDMPVSGGNKVGGFIRSGRVNEDGALLEPLRPVAGALIIVDFQSQNRPPAFIRQGEVVVTSSTNGNFGTFVQGGFSGAGREVVALHPRFPFQRPRASFLPSEGVGAAVIELAFVEGLATGGAVSGSARPVLRVAHTPALPSTGSGTNDGAELILTGVDDKEVQALDAQLIGLTGSGGQSLPADAVTMEVVGADELNPGRVLRRFRVTSTQRGRAEFRCSVADDEGQETTLNYVIHFGLSATITNVSSEDTLGPYVSLAWPPPRAENVPALTPILLRFSEAVPDEFLDQNNLTWVTFGSEHTLQTVTRGTGAREIVLHYRGPTEGKVQVTIGAPLTDENGNSFDQDPATDGEQAYSLEFTQTSPVRPNLPGENGSGIVFHGRYGYGLERSGEGSRLLVFDFEKPGEPTKVDSLALEGFPTALTLIPDYNLAIPQLDDDGAVSSNACVRSSFLAVFTGSSQEAKRLTVLPAVGRVSEGLFGSPLSPPMVSSVVSPANSVSQIVRVKWDAPFLSYLELGDSTGVKLLNLPAFYLGARLSRQDPARLRQLPENGDSGLDEDGDGSYCGPDDRPPLPSTMPGFPFGFAFSWGPDDPQERIQDFDVASGLGLVAVVTAFNDGTTPGFFRVVLSAIDPESLDDAFVTFDAEVRPRRMLLLPAMRLERESGPIVRDVALVTLSKAAGGGLLAVIDVSTPSAPVLLGEIKLPDGENNPSAMVLREDGLLAVATSKSILLVDPAKLLLPAPSGGHPALVAAVNVPGGGSQALVSDTSGINAVFSGGTRQAVLSAPRMRVVTFDRAPFDPASLLAMPGTEVAKILEQANTVSVLELAATDASGRIAADLAPARHHYVVVDAPGGDDDDGKFLSLVLAAVDDRGRLQDRSVKNMAPAVVGDKSVHHALFLKQLIRLISIINIELDAKSFETLGREMTLTELAENLLTSATFQNVLPELQELLQLARDFPLDFQARRLSDDPTSPLYNRYLAGPFLVLPKSPERDEVDALIAQAEQLLSGRRYLRASPWLWVGIASDQASHPVVGKYTSQFKLNPSLTLAGISIPGISVLAETLLSGLAGDSSLLGPLLVGVINTLTPVSADFKPTLMPGANELYRVAYRERPLIFVPGFAGSRLNQQDGEIWPGILMLDKSGLAVRPDGVPSKPTSPPDSLRYILEAGDFKVKEIYGGLLRNLEKSLGYVEYDYFKPPLPDDPFKSYQAQRRRFGGAPNLAQDPVPNLFVYAYDWRLNNATAARVLEEYVKIALFYHPDADGVDLIAHSNGNLVSRDYMNTHPGRVARYISLAAPWAGSGKPLTGLFSGDLDDLPVNVLIPIGVMRRASQFMPGFHQLMPTKALFDLGFPVISEVGYDVNRDGSFYGSLTYDEYAEALEKHLFRKTHAEAGFTGEISPVRANHENFHRPFDGLPISRADSDGAQVETFQFVGMQSTPISFAGARFVGRLHRLATPVENTSVELPFVRTRISEQGADPAKRVDEPTGSLGISTNQYRFRGDVEYLRSLGDGTVPILSLTRGYGSGDMDYNAPHAKLFCMVSTGPAFDEKVGHNPYLGTRELNDWVERALTGRRIPRLDVSVQAPQEVGEGQVFTLSASASGEGVTGSIVTLVDFGDGGTAARKSEGAATLTYRYAQNGTYVISVGATSTNGITGFKSRTINVRNVAPTVSIAGGNTTLNAGSFRIFIAEVNDPGLDDTHTFEWTLDGKPLFGQQSFAAGVSFAAPGTYELTVKATDSDGANGTDSVQVTVTGAQAQGEPSVAQGDAFVPIPSPSGDEPQVFDATPELQVRITGLAPGPFDSKGVVIRDVSQIQYTVETYLLPAAVMGIPQLVAFDPSSLFEVRRVLGGLFDFVVQRTSTDSALVNVMRTMNEDGAQSQISIIEFKTLGGPIQVELVYREGGAPGKLVVWDMDAITNLASSVTFDWESRDLSLNVGGTTIAPAFSAEGLAAGDRAPPSVAAIFNPANGMVTVLGRDNFTPPDKLQFFLVQDNSGDGTLEDDVFYELATNQLARARLPSRPFAIVARDQAGNVTPPVPLLLQEAADYTRENSDYCTQLDRIRSAVQGTIQDGLNSPAVNDLFLLDRGHLWIFEQGSGACLWKANSCVECNGNFLPGISDNDYELFLPAHLGRDYRMLETDRLEFLASGPFDSLTLQGDWYFRPPSGLDINGLPAATPEAVVAWAYRVPSGFSTPTGDTLLLIPRTPEFSPNLANGFPVPLTPAEVIARAFTAAVKADTARAGLLAESTFFPVRREHFMFGVLDVELPPNVGSDPIGDAGMGRQMLLLKWVLEGEFVALQSSSGVNAGLPDLDAVYQNLLAAGVPVVEGLEWGLFHEFAALSAGLAADAFATYGPTGTEHPLVSAAGNDLERKRRSKLKKLGKAAIRATLARLAGDPETAAALFSVSRDGYQSRGLQSYEDFILLVATNDAEMAREVFGEFAEPRPTEEGPDLSDFLSLKRGDNEVLYQEIARLPNGYQMFVQGGLEFLRMIQSDVVVTYADYVANLDPVTGIEERFRRTRNLSMLMNGNPPERRGLNDLREGTSPDPISLMVGIHNYANREAGGVTLQISTGVTGSQGDPLPQAQQDGGGDTTIPDAAPLSGAAVSLELNTTLSSGETETTTISGEDPTDFDGDPVAEDSRVQVTRTSVDVSGGTVPPLEAVMTVHIGAAGGRILTHHPSTPEHPRASPAVLLGKDEGLYCVLSGVSGEVPAGTLKVQVSTDTTTTPAEFQFSVQGGTGGGSYVAGPILFGTAGSPRIVDEEMVTFRLVGLSTELAEQRMVDVAEMAIAGLLFSSTNPAGAVRGFRNALDSDVELDTFFRVEGELFRNDVGSAGVGSGIGNPMGAFILNAGYGSDEFGEGDWLFVNAHGAPDGTLSDEGTLANPQRNILSPEHLQDEQFWRADIDWVILHACTALTNDNDVISIIDSSGADEWAKTMRRNERAPRAVLGFQVPIDNTPAHYELFFLRLSEDEPVLSAWTNAMQIPTQERGWAAVYFESVQNDTLRQLSRNPASVSNNRILYRALDVPSAVCLYSSPEEAVDAFAPHVAAASGVRVSRHPLKVRPFLRDDGAGHAAAGQDPGTRLIPGHVPLDPSVPCRLTEAEAASIADRFVAEALPEFHGNLRRVTLGRRTAGELDPSGHWDARVYAYLVSYEHLLNGVPISGDYVTLDLCDAGVASFSIRLHQPVTKEEPDDPALWVFPISETDAFSVAAQQIQARHGVRLSSSLPLRLEYVPIEGDGERVFVPAWELDIDRAPDPGVALTGAGARVWIHAVSGDVLTPVRQGRIGGGR